MSEVIAGLTAIAGGIGSGKSVVSKILRVMGYEVYDCDREAARIIDTDPAIRRRIASEVDADAVDSAGNLDRRRLASTVFSDPEALVRLNAIVHASVRTDIAEWAAAHPADKRLFVETAILYQSKLDRMVSEVWEVTATECTRILRVMQRNGLSEAEARQRVDAQRIEIERPHGNIHVIVNDGAEPLIPQIHSLL